MLRNRESSRHGSPGHPRDPDEKLVGRNVDGGDDLDQGVDPRDPQPALGAAIRELRRKRGDILKTLAPKAGVSWGTLGVIERGEANPTWGTVKAIAAALEVSLADLAKLSLKYERT